MADKQERLLDQVRKARGDFEASQDEVEKRKNDYFQAVKLLHEEGMPLREIASALGLSHQRVHQMVDEATGKKTPALRRKLTRAAKQGGVVAFLILLAGAGYATLQPGLLRSRAPQAERVTSAPSQIESLNSKHAELRDRMIEFSCAQKLFEWHEAAMDAFGESATVVMEPMCEITKLAPERSGPNEELEAKLRRRLHDLLITIKERA